MRRIALALLVSFSVLPFVWVLVSSVRPESELFGGASFVPRQLTLEHYRALFDRREFWLPVRNSLIVAGSTTALCLVIGAMTAYALARLRFRGKRTVLGFILAVSMFPQISIVTPLFLFLRALRLIDTFPGLVLPYVTFALPLTVWLLVSYFRQIPIELDEAARIDGAGRIGVFIRIVLPLAMPGLATTAILTFIYCWNEFLFALSFTLGPERQTVPVAIALFRGRYEVPWGEILAAATVATLPVAVIVLRFQRRIVQGLTAGALKG
jgi:ABC-type glycerol-3-phosphate transport system permease component